MRVDNIQPISFKIYKGSAKKHYGEYMWGEYKNYKIEVYNAHELKQKLIYVSDKLKYFIKSKLIYFVDGINKVARSERNGTIKQERSNIN